MANEQITAALARLQTELSRLEPAITHIETAKKVSAIADEVVTLSQSSVNAQRKLVDQFVEDAAQVNQGIQSTTVNLLDELAAEYKKIEELRTQIKDFYDRVELINFPLRLDKIDTSVAGIMSAVQTLQNRVDNMERAVVQKLEQQEQHIQGIKKDLSDSFESKFNLAKRFLLGILIVVILACIGIIILVL